MTHKQAGKAFGVLLVVCILTTIGSTTAAVAAEPNGASPLSPIDPSSEVIKKPEIDPEPEPEPTPEYWEEETSESTTEEDAEAEEETEAIEEEAESAPNVWLFVGIGGGVLVLAGIGVAVYFSIRKRRYGYQYAYSRGSKRITKPAGGLHRR